MAIGTVCALFFPYCYFGKFREYDDRFLALARELLAFPIGHTDGSSRRLGEKQQGWPLTDDSDHWLSFGR